MIDVPAWRIPMTCSARCRAGTRCENALYWIDALKPAIHRLDPARDEVESWTPPEKLGSFAPSAGGGLIIAGRNGFALYDPRGGRFERIADPENKAEENILNDGRCDSRGRFWAGSMTKTMQRASGKLYRVDTRPCRCVRRRHLGVERRRLEPGRQDDVFRRQPRAHDLRL